MKLIISACFIFITIQAFSQQLYIIPKVSAANGVYTKRLIEKRIDIDTKKPQLYFQPFLDVVYQQANKSLVLSLTSNLVGNSFSIINIHSNNAVFPIVGTEFSTGISALQLSLAVKFDSRNFSSFIGNSLIKPNYKVGMGIIFNRSQSYYKEQFSSSAAFIEDKVSQMGYTQTIQKIGNGIVLCNSVGIDIFNKRKKRILTTDLFLDFGLKNMALFNMRYEYGNYKPNTLTPDFPNNYTYVNNYKTTTRGTQWGIKIGIPINLKYFKK